MPCLGVLFQLRLCFPWQERGQNAASIGVLGLRSSMESSFKCTGAAQLQGCLAEGDHPPSAPLPSSHRRAGAFACCRRLRPACAAHTHNHGDLTHYSSFFLRLLTPSFGVLQAKSISQNRWHVPAILRRGRGSWGGGGGSGFPLDGA